MAYKTFVAGEEALASDVNSYLMSQTVSRFTSAAARTAAISTPILNQLSMLDTSPGFIDYWDGSAWVSFPATRVDLRTNTVPVSDLGASPATLSSMDFSTRPYPRQFILNATLTGAPVSGDVGPVMEFAINGTTRSVASLGRYQPAGEGNQTMALSYQTTAAANAPMVINLRGYKQVGSGLWRTVNDGTLSFFQASARPYA